MARVDVLCQGCGRKVAYFREGGTILCIAYQKRWQEFVAGEAGGFARVLCSCNCINIIPCTPVLSVSVGTLLTTGPMTTA